MGKSGVPNRRGTSSTAGGAKLEGVLLFQVSVWSELWEHAAAAGFKHFTKEYLDHAIVSENQCERLSTSLRKHHTLEKIFGLVEYALPDRDGSVYKRAARGRGGTTTIRDVSLSHYKSQYLRCDWMYIDRPPLLDVQNALARLSRYDEY